MTKQVIQLETVEKDEESSIFRVWRWWKVIWTIVRNIIYISLILLAFGKASSPFENVVLCFLVLILEAVNWSHTAQLRLAIEEAFSTKRLFFTVLKKGGEETEDAEATISEVEKKYLKQNTLYYINLGGASVIISLFSGRRLLRSYIDEFG